MVRKFNEFNESINSVPLITHRMGFSHDENVFSEFIMTKDGSGYVRLNIFLGDGVSGVMEDLSVSEGSRKHGVGLSLVQACEKISRENGCEELILWVEKDSWVRGWYEKLGFVEYELDKDHPSRVWMSKDFTKE